MVNAINDPDDDAVGFNLNTQKLHCLMVLDDDIGKALSAQTGGEAFFRAFIVEDRKSGEVRMNQRFRYKRGDSWYRLRPSEEHQRLPVKERVEYLAATIEGTLRMAAEALAGGAEPPAGFVERFYPPDPDDAEKTIQWLIAHDLVEIKSVVVDGQEKKVSKSPNAVM